MDITTSVTGVLVTGKTPARYPLARLAVRSWLEQTYPGKRNLLIVNDHPSLALYPGELPPGVSEVRVRDRLSLGELRNVGIIHSQGDYLVQWDDDDYSHPNRLQYQMERTGHGNASIFRWEMHCHLKTGEVFANNGRDMRASGFPGTMLWPRYAAAVFPAIGKAEDTEFVLQLRKTCGLNVISNDPMMYLRCYHGHNTWHEDHVMRRRQGSRTLTAAESSYVQTLLRTVYSDVIKELKGE